MDLLTRFVRLPLKYRQPPRGTLATQFASAPLQHTTIYIATCFKGKVFQQELRKEKVFFTERQVNSYSDIFKVKNQWRKKIKQKAKNLFHIMSLFIVSHFSAVIKTRYDVENQCLLMDWIRI